jgi:ATP synthase protein I
MVKTMTEQARGAQPAKSASELDDAEDGMKGEMDFVPLTREQAQRLREQEPTVSIWWIVLGQLAVGLVAALVAWVATDKSHVAWSVLYGALAVVIPGALFARGLTSQFSSISPVTAGFGFFVWEAVKIGVSVGMLAAAPRLVADLDWLAMLIGLILALKVYWLALLLRHKRKTA